MVEVEQRVRDWVDTVNTGVRPVTAAEAQERARQGRRRPPVLLAAAAAVVVIAGAVGLWVLAGEDATEVVVGEERSDELLGLVPADAEGLVQVWDFARARALTATAVPERDAPAEAVVEYADRLAVAGADPLGVFAEETSRFGDRTHPDALAQELGLSAGEFDQAVRYGAPPEVVTLLVGDFDWERITDAARTDPGWSDLLDENHYRDVPYLAWGGDLEVDTDRASPLRPLGFGMRAAVVEGVLIWARSTSSLTHTIDHLLDDGPSVADFEPATVAARHADEHSLTAWTPYAVADGTLRAAVAGRSTRDGEPVTIAAFEFTSNRAVEDAEAHLPELLAQAQPPLADTLVETAVDGAALTITARRQAATALQAAVPSLLHQLTSLEGQHSGTLPAPSTVISWLFFAGMLALVLHLVARGGGSSRTTTTDPSVLHEIQKRAQGGNAP